MKITVCIGSSCHIKGSNAVVEGLRRLIGENNLEEQIDLSGAFCMNKCQCGVCVKIDGELYSVFPETVGDFFENTVLEKINRNNENRDCRPNDIY